jgi:multidrug resistance efflux pump
MAGAPIVTMQPFAASSPVQLKSPVRGVVRGQFVNIGEGVQQGQTLLTVTADLPADGPIAIVAFVGPTQVALLHPGDRVQVNFSNGSAGNTTVMEGHISAVDRTPSPQLDVDAEAGAGDVAKALVNEAGGIPYRVSISLDAPAGLRDALSGGQVLSLLVTESSVRPISLIFGN